MGRQVQGDWLGRHSTGEERRLEDRWSECAGAMMNLKLRQGSYRYCWGQPVIELLVLQPGAQGRWKSMIEPVDAEVHSGSDAGR